MWKAACLAPTPTIQYCPQMASLANSDASFKLQWIVCAFSTQQYINQWTNQLFVSASNKQRSGWKCTLRHWALSHNHNSDSLNGWCCLIWCPSSPVCVPAPLPGLVWAFDYWALQNMNLAPMQNSIEIWVSNTWMCLGVYLPSEKCN